MKKTIFFTLFSIFYLSNFSGWAQEFEVPLHYKFENIEDYAFYRQDVLDAINWLETTPLNEESEKRDLVNNFLFEWLSGSPSISINIHPYVMEISNYDSNLLMVFMGGWAKHQMRYEEKNSLKLNMLGIHAILNLYKLGGTAKDKNMEKLIKMEKKGELEKWVQERIG